jgi:hypothetical protein
VSTFVNRDGSTEAWDGDNYVPLGSMRVSDRPLRAEETFPPPPRLYMVIEEYPTFTIAEFQKLARDQRKQRNRKVRFRRLLRRAADLAARGTGGDS